MVSDNLDKYRKILLTSMILVVAICFVIYMIKDNNNHNNYDSTTSPPSSSVTDDVTGSETGSSVTETTTAGGEEASETTTDKESVVSESLTDDAQESSSSGLTTTKASTTSTTANTQGSDYEYAYAGFNPVDAKVDGVEWNLILVNRDYILPDDYEYQKATAASGYDTQMDSRVAPHYQEMFKAAKEDGITLVPLSGSRSISTQKRNFENKIQTYRDRGYSKAEATQLAAQIILPPGTSEHNAGLAMDICSLDKNFEDTKEFRWLNEHAADYGFILRYAENKQSVTKITYEPWHWRYVGVEAAKAMKASGQCLEEYLGLS